MSLSLLATPVFLLSAATAFLQSASAQLPLSFIPGCSVALGLTAGTGATLLLSVANVVNALARVATGYAGDRFGRLNVLAVSLAGCAIVGALWGMSVRASQGPEQARDHGASALQLWIAFIVLYSTASGGYNSLFPATIADVFGIRNYASVNGFIYRGMAPCWLDRLCSWAGCAGQTRCGGVGPGEPEQGFGAEVLRAGV